MKLRREVKLVHSVNKTKLDVAPFVPTVRVSTSETVGLICYRYIQHLIKIEPYLQSPFSGDQFFPLLLQRSAQLLNIEESGDDTVMRVLGLV